MTKIDYGEIDFDKLTRLYGIHSESKVFHDEKNFYKIYKDIYHADTYKIAQKLELFSQTNIEEAIIPQTPIYEAWIMRGFIASYKPDTKTLDNLINDLENYLIATIKASSILRDKLHRCEIPIIVGDMHLSQIIVDKNLNTFWCDCDSYKIGDIPNNTFSTLLIRYIEKVANGKNILASAQTDKLGMLLYFIYYLFENWNLGWCLCLPKNMILKHYDKQAEQYKFLKKIRPVFEEIIKCKPYIPDIPYIDEMISLEDVKDVARILK